MQDISPFRVLFFDSWTKGRRECSIAFRDIERGTPLSWELLV
jgi:hypothetical protein